MHIAIFNNISLHIKENSTHKFLLSNKDVALGYEVTQQTINDHKNRFHQDELIEGKHWVRLHVETNGGMQNVIHWTKKGIVRLGFFIKSHQAKAFRDWAEDYIVNPNNQQINPTTLNSIQSMLMKQQEVLEALVTKVHLLEQPQHSQTLLHVKKLHVMNKLDLFASLTNYENILLQQIVKNHTDEKLNISLNSCIKQELAEELYSSYASIHQLIHRLVQKGYLIRTKERRGWKYKLNKQFPTNLI